MKSGESVTTEHPELRALVRAAEARAAVTCELCGNPGVLQVRSSGWMKTLCSVTTL